MTTQPKLSALIRKGAAMVDGKCIGDYIEQHPGEIYCCAMGAAYYAFTGELPLSKDNPACDVLDMLAGNGISTSGQVFHMNDTANMSFEDIADELESKGL